MQIPMQIPRVGQGQQQIQFDVDPVKQPAVKCQKCEGKLFTPGTIFHKISGLANSTGKIVYYQEQRMFCVNCKQILPLNP